MRTPLVFFDRRIAELPFSSVVVDDFEGAKRAVEYMIEKGYTRIAHIAGSLDTEIGRARWEGYREALANHDLALRQEWIVDGGFDERHGYRAAQMILALDEIPDVIFAATFPVGLGVRAAIREHDDITLDHLQILSFGVGGFDEFFLYPHYCVRQPTEEMGREAVRLLLEEVDALDGGEEPPEPRKVVLETMLMLPSNGHGLDDEGIRLADNDARLTAGDSP